MPAVLHNVKNNAFTTLANACGASDTSIVVVSDVFPTAPFYVSIDNEILEVTAKSGTTFTVTRGVDGSVATGHNAGANVELRMVAGIISELQDLVLNHKHLGSDAVKLTHDALDLANTSAFRAYQSSAQSISANTWTKINFQTVEYDHLGEYNTSINTFTVQESGIYLISACVRYDVTASTVSIFVNGTTHTRLRYNMSGASAHSVPIKLNAGDTVDVRIYTATAGSITAEQSGTYFTAVRLV